VGRSFFWGGGKVLWTVRQRRAAGFTLVELLIVLAVFGTLTMVAFPTVSQTSPGRWPRWRSSWATPTPGSTTGRRI